VKGEDHPQSVLLLDDLRSHKTKKILEEFRTLYNTRIIVLPGGLTPKTQIMDTHNNRPFKASFRKKISAIRLAKYKVAKAERDADPIKKKTRIAIPRITRAEALECMLEAWDELPAELGANAWQTVKLYPYEAAVLIGLTPKEAFESIRQFDYQCQSVSNILPKDAGSDIDAFEWDNVPEEFYADTKTPAEVRAEVEVVATEPTTDTSTKKTVPPSERKLNPIFTFLQPPLLPCTQENCDEENPLTKSRCQSCSKAGHGNCLHDRVLCTECYNARMTTHKQDMAKNRAAKKSNPAATPAKKARVTSTREPATKKVKVTSGLSKKTAPVPAKAQKAIPISRSNTRASAAITRSTTMSRDPKERAEERMLQAAILESVKECAPPLTPVKPQRELVPGTFIAAYANVFDKNNVGVSELSAIDVEKLTNSVHSDGYSVIDSEEATVIKQTREAHISFMMSRRQSALIAFLLGPKNIALLDGLVFNSNIRECEINMNFRLFDLCGLLSYRFVTDSVLQCYMHYLQSKTNIIYFVNPQLYNYMDTFDKRPTAPFDCDDWLNY